MEETKLNKQTHNRKHLEEDSFLDVYVNIKQWNVGKMKMSYDIIFLVLIQVIYQRDKICYFDNKNVISMTKVDTRELVNWAKVMFKNLIKELDIWSKTHAKMIERKSKLDAKKDMCNFALPIKVLMQHWFHEEQFQGLTIVTMS
jgi:hypothetical protein